jgi:hypothetical protein
MPLPIRSILKNGNNKAKQQAYNDVEGRFILYAFVVMGWCRDFYPLPS